MGIYLVKFDGLLTGPGAGEHRGGLLGEADALHADFTNEGQEGFRLHWDVVNVIIIIE